MKTLKYISITIVFALAASTIWVKDSLSKDVFRIYRDKVFSVKGLARTENIKPERDILFVPSLKDKEFFESVNDKSICRRKDVRKYLYIYLTTGRPFVKRAIRKSHLYLDIIEKILEKNKDIPPDIALLPILESGFNPHAVSRSRAVGLWQFLLSTSKILGLRTDKWIDERKDIEKSTSAAIRHLRNLYRMLHSWDLALAAYNGGAGHVKRAMIKTGTHTFWDLQKTGALRKEPSEYVSRYAALVIIFKNRDHFGLTDEIKKPVHIATENLTFEYPVNIRAIARVSKLSVNTIRSYNPELKRNYTPPYYKQYKLRLPVSVKSRIKKKLNGFMLSDSRR